MNAITGEAALGIDVGGTKLAAGLVSASGQVLDRTRRQTPANDGDKIRDAIVEIVGELAAGASVPVGVGAAGIIDLDGVVRYSPNIAWADYPLRARLTDDLGAAVTVDNDANAAAWGEYRVGAGVDAHVSMLMLTIGTGVGGGLISQGQLVRGSSGLAAEFGHLVLLEGGPRCGCGNLGCLEALASGSAIGREAAAALALGSAVADSALHQMAEVTGKTVTQAAQGGDGLATDVLARCGFWLGVGIASLVNAVDPELVVVGGGAMQAGELLLGSARDAYRERLVGRAHRRAPDVVPAALADDAGLIGAALLALEALPAQAA